MPLTKIKSEHKKPSVMVQLDTDVGAIVIEVNTAAAPKTSAYFLGLVDQNLFSDASFYRSGASFASDTSQSQLVQGGVLHHIMSGIERTAISEIGVPLLKEIETTDATGLQHQLATVSFARDLFATGYVIPELFICLGELPQCDSYGRTEPDTLGFPAFAKVVSGMNVVQEIANRDTGGATTMSALQGQMLSHPVPILRVFRC
ncbi:MAG: peptidyl-prolyl cis-trans isomerase A (cyclophilin A) [Litorivivens sp.]|jgi:peptidyl-prolyl cis-trans isomerase A (cyclophilin A)